MGAEAIIPRVEKGLGFTSRDDASWSAVPALTLVRAEDGSPPEQATSVRVAYHEDALVMRFDCRDRDVWATHTRRDAALWEEEVVEVFLAPGPDDPSDYFEVEVNPLGTLFDARVSNPDGRRATMSVDTSWDAAGITAVVDRAPGSWRADIVIPWRSVRQGELVSKWRANFFRVERPRGGEPEFSAWSPTLVRPADFHKPSRFGAIVLGPIR